MPARTDEVRNVFLDETRIGILSTLTSDGWPVSVPVWFEWDGERARVFTNARSPKVRRLKQDSRASLLVVNHVGEPEYWVAIDGHVQIREEGAFALAERLAERYWDMTNARHRKSVESWSRNEARLRVLEIAPKRIRTYQS